MPFIGVIAKESDNNFIKKEILKNTEKSKLEILNINKNSIENIKNIYFDAVIINEKLTDFLKCSKYLEDIIKKAKYLVINLDFIENTDFIKMYNNKINIVNKKQRENESKIQDKQIITYGLNQKAIITMSSIKPENILICVQNKYKNYYGKIVEEQEVNVEITKNNLKKICNSMAIFTILTIFGENLKKI